MIVSDYYDNIVIITFVIYIIFSLKHEQLCSFLMPKIVHINLQFSRMFDE